MTQMIPWHERREVDRLRSQIDRVFRDFFDMKPFRLPFEGSDWVPAVDVSETDKEILVHAEVPGMNPKDMDISLNGRLLTIKGEKKQEQEEKEKNFHRLERTYGSFIRSFELPADVDPDKVKASYKDGVLTLTLPKAREQEVKKIEIKTG
ncbi:MAG: Hsp20/alpha crystallin family protein [Deltaproteobacteria bacterium]|nr:Hsp20/alpha crystallin family protein [Deltaproteobacteria bacterium]